MPSDPTTLEFRVGRFHWVAVPSDNSGRYRIGTYFDDKFVGPSVEVGPEPPIEDVMHDALQSRLYGE